LISAIIVRSAVPLVRSASFILLQGVPVGVEIEEIRQEIKAIPGVISIHDLHIWQLTSIKMVASLHILVTDQQVFERASRAVKTVMHRSGVHSTTIQPEFTTTHPYLSQDARGSDEETQVILSREVTASLSISLEAVPQAAGDLISESQTIESNCTLLCADGEQACDIGSCCTAPVKR
jgi:zinc transporter 1